MKHPRVFVAGTFDGLHKGHEFLLSRAFEEGEQVTIGLTSDQFVKQFKIIHVTLRIRNYKEREKELIDWLIAKELKSRSIIIPIHDPWEPAASYTEPFVLVVSSDTLNRGKELNMLRKKRGLVPARLVVVPLVTAEDGMPISSTRVRMREIDEQGRLNLPDALRPELQHPMGPVRTGRAIDQSIQDHRGDVIITVGDIATKTFLDAGVTPALIIIDNLVERKPYRGLARWKRTTSLRSDVVKSGPGYIAQEPIELIKKWAGNPGKAMLIEVRGEEDLLALPAIAYAPVGSVVYYGQPQIADVRGKPQPEGLVEVVVTEEKKKEAIAHLNRFTQ